MSDPYYNDKGMGHYRTRAIGSLLTRTDDRKVTRLIVHEMEFKSSNEAQKFIDAARLKAMNKRGLCGQRRLKLASIPSD